MRLLLVPLLLTFSLTGCLIYVHDSNLAGLKPVPATLENFAGTYYNDASYHTPTNMLGLEGWETLGGALAGLNFRSSVKIEITGEGDIRVGAAGGAFGPISIRYVHGRDFEFKDNSVVFSALRSSGTSEVAIGTIKRSMVWMLDSSKRLVVIDRGGGAGLMLGVIPTVASGATYSTFARKSGGDQP